MWVGKGSEFYQWSIESWLEDNNIDNNNVFKK